MENDYFRRWNSFLVQRSERRYLHGFTGRILSLDEKIMEVTDVLKNKIEMEQANKKVCLKLNHALYGLVQSARSWWLKFVNTLVNVGFERGEVDPCLIFWKNECRIFILILYVDDCLLTGDILAIESGN